MVSMRDDERPDLHVVDDGPPGGPPRPDVEKALLSALLTAPATIPQAATVLVGGDFHQPAHEAVWHAILDAATAGVTDPILLGRRVVDRLATTDPAAAARLADIVSYGGEPLSVAAYAEQVADDARCRLIATTGRKLAQIGDSGRSDDAARALEHAATTLDETTKRALHGNTRPHDAIAYTPIYGLFTRPRTPTPWLVSPLLAAGRVTLLYSPGKTGKSLIAMEAAAALASGRAAFRTSATRRPRHVLYVDQEMTEEDWADRLAAMGYGVDDEAVLAEHLHLAQLQAWPPMDTAAGGSALFAHARTTDAEAVVVDTVSKVTSGEENANDTHQAFYQHSLVPLKRAGIAALVLDHTGKDVTKGARGGSAKTDNVDLAFELALRGRDLLTLRCSHARFRDDALEHPTFLRRTTSPLAHHVEDREWEKDDNGPGMRPTHLMEKVALFLAAHPSASKNLIEQAKLGKAEYVRLALGLLVNEGYVDETITSRGHEHTLVKPYVEGQDELF